MLATTEQMRELDRTAIEERGIPSLELMENAAREVAQAVDLPILGMGGVSKGEDAAQMMLAGASAVAVGTACFDDPYAPIKVRDGLASLAERQGLNKVSDFTGAVVPW